MTDEESIYIARWSFGEWIYIDPTDIDPTGRTQLRQHPYNMAAAGRPIIRVSPDDIAGLVESDEDEEGFVEVRAIVMKEHGEVIDGSEVIDPMSLEIPDDEALLSDVRRALPLYHGGELIPTKPAYFTRFAPEHRHLLDGVRDEPVLFFSESEDVAKFYGDDDPFEVDDDGDPSTFDEMNAFGHWVEVIDQWLNPAATILDTPPREFMFVIDDMEKFSAWKE